MLTYKTVKIVCNYRRNALWFRNSSRRDCLKPTGCARAAPILALSRSVFFSLLFSPSVVWVPTRANSSEHTTSESLSAWSTNTLTSQRPSYFILFKPLQLEEFYTLIKLCSRFVSSDKKFIKCKPIFSPLCALSVEESKHRNFLTGNVIIICVLLHQVRCCVLFRV